VPSIINENAKKMCCSIEQQVFSILLFSRGRN
jgi:hypothetical protein